MRESLQGYLYAEYSNTQRFTILILSRLCQTVTKVHRILATWHLTLLLCNCSHPVKNAWDDQKSIARNLKEMGLSADPNKSLHIATTRVCAACYLTQYNLDLIGEVIHCASFISVNKIIVSPN